MVLHFVLLVPEIVDKYLNILSSKTIYNRFTTDSYIVTLVFRLCAHKQRLE